MNEENQPKKLSVEEQKKVNRTIMILLLIMALGTISPLLMFYFFR